MTHVITRACCNDATCVVVCPVDCIHPTPDEPDYGHAEMLYIDPGNCIDCGACVDVCPVDAIAPLDELTEATGRFAEINAHYFTDRNYPRQLAEQPPPRSGGTVAGSGGTAAPPGPLRVAIVGSGPAACYAADELLSTRGLDIEVHMFERLPTPWGLVRSGVAPDHPDTKAVSRLFQRTTARRHTTPELLALMQLPGVDIEAHPDEAALDPLTTAALRAHPEPMAELKARLVAELAARTPRVSARGRSGRRIRLRYLHSPLELLGADRVRGVRVGRNELARGADGRLDAVDTGHAEEVGCGLVLRVVGCRGAPVPGLPFDQVRGTLPNQGGRVIDPTNGQPIPGVYAAGWIKRGPSGVIGANKKCARDTAQALLADHAAGRLVGPALTAESLRELLARRQPDAVDYAGWKAIDAHERSAGGRHGRPRVKLVRVADLVRAAGSRYSPDGC
jgi:NAD-dependent dihydropyrimidine dehydrogenase PreA subunit